MDLTHSNGSALEITDGGRTRTREAGFLAGVVTVVAIAGLLAIALVAASRGGPSTELDPLVGPAAIEFRAGERGLTSTQLDPLVGPAAIEFRAGERGDASR